MRIALLALFVLSFAFEASAQRRPVGPRYNPPGRDRIVVHSGPRHPVPGTVVVHPPRRYHPAPRHVVVRPPRVVGPRYNPNPYSRRYVRPARRAPIRWSTPFGYACGRYNELMLNGRVIHDFTFAHECHQAIEDIRIYGDFCDREDLYDQTGILEAQFTFSSECRNALGWYY